MVTAQRHLPPLPEVGHADAFYTHAIELAEQERDVHKRSAMKVGRYISLALNPAIPWGEKQRYLLHALKHYCVSPTLDEPTQNYYEELGELVREHAGAEALRLASQEDDMYAARVALGQDRANIEDDAEAFFLRLLGPGDQRPSLFNDVDWQQLKLIRDQWI